MPQPRYGTIPRTRLADARRVRDHYRTTLGDRAEVTLTIRGGGFAVSVRLREGVKLDVPLPRSHDGIPVIAGRVPRTARLS